MRPRRVRVPRIVSLSSNCRRRRRSRRHRRRAFRRRLGGLGSEHVDAAFSVSVGDGAGLDLRLLEPYVRTVELIQDVHGKNADQHVDAKILRGRSEVIRVGGVSRHPSLVRRIEYMTPALPSVGVGALFNPVGSHLLAHGLPPGHQIQLLLGVVVGGPGIPRTHDDRRLIPAPRER